MHKRVLLFLVVALILSSTLIASAAESDFSKEQIVAIATEAVKAKGLELKDVNIIYDEDGQLWSERLGVVGYEDTTPNHGILREGFLKNYKIVFFDYKEPLNDVWVFIDKDTGEVLAVYQE